MEPLNDTLKMVSDPLPLKERVIDLWRVNLELAPVSIGVLFAMLSNDEKARADRFRFPTDKQHFIAGRGTLRLIMGVYLGLAPEKVRFSYNRFGKPGLAAESSRLRFNVSHSRGVGVVAVTVDREVGIDIEFVDHKFEVLSVARSAFSATEVARLKSLPETSRTAAFYEYWTRKEACLKAMGDGLSSSREQKSAVAAIIRENEAFFSAPVDNRIREWSLRSIGIDEDYKAAIAVEGKIETIRHRFLPEDFKLSPKFATGLNGSAGSNGYVRDPNHADLKINMLIATEL